MEDHLVNKWCWYFVNLDEHSVFFVIGITNNLQFAGKGNPFVHTHFALVFRGYNNAIFTEIISLWHLCFESNQPIIPDEETRTRGNMDEKCTFP